MKDIYSYICQDNPEVALRTILAISERAASLERFPLRGRRYELSERHVRILQYEHYRIAYLVKDDVGVEILGVFHGALDIDRFELQAFCLMVKKLREAQD